MNGVILNEWSKTISHLSDNPINNIVFIYLLNHIGDCKRKTEKKHYKKSVNNSKTGLFTKLDKRLESLNQLIQIIVLYLILEILNK